MNKIVLAFLLSFCSTIVAAQKTYFVYIESEAKQPFFVKLANEILNSTSSGYLIVSNLKDSSYVFSIGIPGQVLDQHYLIEINKKDHGYLLKNFGEKGWGLFDLQNLTVVPAYTSPVNTGNTNIKIERIESNSFTDMLARATDDSTVWQRHVFTKAEEKKRVTDTQPVVQKEPELLQQEVKRISDPEINLGKDTYVKSKVTRWSESSTTEGFGLVFLDVLLNGKTDTIRLIIPNEQRVLVEKEKMLQPQQNNIKFLDFVIESTKDNKTIQPVASEIQSKKEEVKPKTEELPVEIKVKEDVQKIPVATTANNCKEMATESDFFEVRKRMASEINEDDMIFQARQYFKTKCFTTLQVKNLGALFLTDVRKYRFYDAAYNYVSDSKNFPTLQSELKDEYYIKRFKAMIRD